MKRERGVVEATEVVDGKTCSRDCDDESTASRTVIWGECIGVRQIVVPTKTRHSKVYARLRGACRLFYIRTDCPTGALRDEHCFFRLLT